MNDMTWVVSGTKLAISKNLPQVLPEANVGQGVSNMHTRMVLACACMSMSRNVGMLTVQ
jgi:hypothetical protein